MMYREFIAKLVPANYFITKSMELSRLGSAGTLWYTKKFLVYYYYIFLYKNIETIQTVREIRLIFDRYIASMPLVMQQEARRFFYGASPFCDLRSPQFKLFSSFAGNRNFANDGERNDYYEMAKKYYMAFLMESGGQSGVKEYIKSRLYTQHFCFSDIDNIILNFNPQYSSGEVTSIKNDYMAFLRNERQILFYFGFFHSKSSGANDIEFSSLTPIGSLALSASYWELIAIWEHQKVKMVSQPVTIDINQIQGLNVNCENFAINRDPYLTILNWLKHRNGLSKKEFTYIVSRTKSPLSPAEIDELVQHIDEIGGHIESFPRRGDKIASADFLKELKKYTLGIVDMQNDFGENPLALCSYDIRRSQYNVTSMQNLSNVIELYKHLVQYKSLRYGDIFNRCERELKTQYDTKVNGRDYQINASIKIEWDLYNIRIDKYILLGAMVAIVESILGITFNGANVNQYVTLIRRKFRGTIDFLGLSLSSLKKELSLLAKVISSNDYTLLLPDASYTQSGIEHTTYNREVNEGTLQKILEESDKTSTYENGERKRNFTLIALVRKYNSVVYSGQEGMLCECCHNTTFKTDSEDFYMEYHHLIPFSICDGPDDYKNIFALCPMCHRKMHYLRHSDKLMLYQNLSDNNYLNESIENRLVELFRKGKIYSYQLEYLLADNAITVEQYNRITQ